MRNHFIARRCLVALCAAIFAAPLAAQQSDSLPFRAGQWGAEFSAANFSGVGVLRFSNPRRAWLMDLQGSVTRQSGSSERMTNADVSTDSETAQFRLGRRAYKPLVSRVVRYVGGGLSARYASFDQYPTPFSVSPPLVYTPTRSQFEAGLFAEVGAQWMITPNLGLGAAWSADVHVGRAETSSLTLYSGLPPSNTKSTVNTISASLGALAIRGSIFF
ncbi:MAG: hypothetical protein IT353_23590 [Gemmatimonadaceae bacterium]|nr:hypothetical protein [Gemmatimonadaceae bacterium]